MSSSRPLLPPPSSRSSSFLEMESTGIRSYLLLMFLTVLLFCTYHLNLLTGFVAEHHEDDRIRLQIDKIQLQRANIKRAARKPDQPHNLKPPQSQIYRESKLPDWVTPREPKTKREKKKDDVFGEEEADAELRVQMIDWLRETTGQSQQLQSDDVIDRLRKRQQLVEDALEAVVDNAPSLDDIMQGLQVSGSSSTGNDMDSSYRGRTHTALHTTTRDSSSSSSSDKTVVVPNPAFANMRASNLFISISSQSRAFVEHLQSMGYSPATQRTPLPLFVLAFGSRCPATDTQDDATSHERHVFICAKYLPSIPYVPRYMYTRSSKSVFEDLVNSPRVSIKSQKNTLLADAMAEVFDPQTFSRPSFRLNIAKDRTKLEAALALQSDARPIYVVEPGDGSPLEFTDVAASLISNQKKHEAKQLTLYGFDLNPPLWDSRLFILRGFVVVFESDPLQALYADGPVLRAPSRFTPPRAGAAAGMSNTDQYFPSSKWEVVKNLAEAVKKGLVVHDEQAILTRMRQIASFVLISGGVHSVMAPSGGGGGGSGGGQGTKVYVQHLCLDFMLVDNGKTVLLSQVRTAHCDVSYHEHVLVHHVDAIAEEFLVRKARGETLAFSAFSSYPDASLAGLNTLIDEARERSTAGRSLLDALESLLPKASSNAGGESEAYILEKCRQPTFVLGGGTPPRTSLLSSFVTHVPECSSQSLDEIFSQERSVGNGERVDDALYGVEVERALTQCFASLRAGNFVSAMSDAGEAGYSLCRRRMHGNSLAIAFVPIVRGFAPLVAVAFTCEGHSGMRKVVIEIPHPFFDHTRQEGLDMFDEPGGVHALLLSGTHRCAEAKPSGCTGNVGKPIRTNCPGHDDYTEADVAHSTRHTFQFLHVLLSTTMFPHDIILSLHSTKQAAFVVSDGTSHATNSTSTLAVFARSLASTFPDRVVEACNPFPGSPNPRGLKEEEKDVCGATNVQGRHLNGAPDPCKAKMTQNGSPLTSSGRFIHVEQPVELVKSLDGLGIAVRRIAKALDVFR